ncbi:MAG TPA: hypothetical protein VGV14_14580 [Rhodanobacter sp.]|nr:hypothetical protein [Rhodanobacter sp.]
MDLKLQVLLQALDKATGPLNKIKGAGSGAAAQLKKTRDALRQLDQAQKNVGEFRKLKQGTADTTRRMAELQARTRAVAQQMKTSVTGSGELSREFKKLTADGAKLKAEHTAQQAKLQTLRTALREAGINTHQLGTAEAALRAKAASATRSIEQQTAALRAQGVQAQRLAKLHDQLRKGEALGAHLSVTGYATREGGRRILEQVTPAIDEAKHYQILTEQLRAQGTSSSDVARAQRFASTDTTAGSSQSDKLEILKDANSIFRDMNEALHIAPALLKTKLTFEALMAQHGEGAGHGQEIVGELIAAIQTGELRNATKTPEAFNHLLDMMTKAYVGSGGLVKPSDYLQTMKVGGVATKQMDEKALFFGAMHTIQEMGGMRSGTGFASAYQNWAAGRSTQQTAEALGQLGLVNKGAVKYGKNGHITKMLPGALKNQALYESNPFDYLMKEVIPRIDPKGKLTENQIVSKLNSLFSARKGGDLFAGMYMQRGNIQKQLAASAHFEGTEAAYQRTVGTAQGQEADLLAKKADLYKELGTSLLPVYVGVLQKLVGVLKALTGAAQRHPAIAKGIALIAAGFGILMVAAGGVMIALGGLIGQFALLRFAIGRAGLGLLARRSAAGVAAGAGGEAAGAGLFARVAMLGRSILPAIIGGASAAATALAAITLPVWVIVAALAALGIAVWKYWGPIKAWFIGFGQGISTVVGSAFAELGHALAPLKPLWHGIAGAIQSVWIWIKQLFAPFQATTAQLDAATDSGRTWGHAIGYAISSVVVLVKWLVQAVGWAFGKLNALGEWIGGKVFEVVELWKKHWGIVSVFMDGIGEAIKAPFTTAFQWISDKIDGFMEKWRALKAALHIADDPVAAAGIHWNTGDASDSKPGARFAIDNRPPLRAGGGGTVTNHNQYSVTVQAMPGHEEAAARAASAELDRRERAKAAAGRSRLGDTE